MKVKQINAKIIADSKCPKGNRITTFVLTYPRIIHGELMTHRMFSRNAASSRAIPFNKMVKAIEEDPFTPIAWQKDHKGMQGSEYWTSEDVADNVGYVSMRGSKMIDYLEHEWLLARDSAIRQAKVLNSSGLTKQLCNRLLEEQ